MRFDFFLPPAEEPEALQEGVDDGPPAVNDAAAAQPSRGTSRGVPRSGSCLFYIQLGPASADVGHHSVPT